MPLNAWILAGATATGKSAVCQLIAERMGLSILSADSMLVYKGMDIGTAKPSLEERKRVSYYGIDLVTPDQPFSTGAWLKAVRTTLPSVIGPKNHPLLVTGGTGLYIKSLTSGLDSDEVDIRRRNHWLRVLQNNGLDNLKKSITARLPEPPAELLNSQNPRRLVRALIHLDSSGRLPDNWEKSREPVITALAIPRDQLRSRILKRINIMFERGLMNEVEKLKELYPLWSETAAKAIGYEETLAILDGILSKEEAIEKICLRTRQLAKRQETWFRHQHNTIWCQIQDGDCIEEIADKVLSLWSKHGTTEIKI